MKKLFFSVLCTLAMATVFSQTSPKEQKIRDLLEMTGSAKLGVMMSHSLLSTFRNSYKVVPEEYWDSLQSKINTQQIIALIIPVYNKYYTETDIDKLIQFYKTPVGKKTISVLPQITQESMHAGQEWGQKIAEEIIRNLKEKGFTESKG
jgi:hypothetical protein